MTGYALQTWSGTCLIDGCWVDEATARDYAKMVDRDLPANGETVLIADDLPGGCRTFLVASEARERLDALVQKAKELAEVERIAKELGAKARKAYLGKHGEEPDPLTHDDETATALWASDWQTMVEQEKATDEERETALFAWDCGFFDWD